MKTLDLKSLIIGVLLTMVVVAFMLIATTNNTPRAWDYQVVNGFMQGSQYQDKINAAAQAGWEVVGVGYSTDSQPRPFAVMRKAKEGQRTSWWRFWKK